MNIINIDYIINYIKKLNPNISYDEIIDEIDEFAKDMSKEAWIYQELSNRKWNEEIGDIEYTDNLVTDVFIEFVNQRKIYKSSVKYKYMCD